MTQEDLPLKRLHEDIVDGFRGINERLDRLNGRVRTLETKAAFIWGIATALTTLTGLWLYLK